MRKMLILWFIIALAALVYLSCDLGSTGPKTYERIVIDTYEVSGAPETDLTLYDDTGTELGSNEASASVPGSIDTYTEGILMSSGIYYIKVDDKDKIYIGPYAVRVLSLNVVDSLPAPVPGSIVYPDPYESDDDAPGNVPTNPVEIFLGNDNYLNRYLGYIVPVANPIDDDWLKLVLP